MERLKKILAGVKRAAVVAAAKVEQLAPMLLVVVTLATAWLLIGQYRTSQAQSKENDREVAELCVQSWNGRADIRQFVIDASVLSERAGNKAILDTVRATSPTPEAYDLELELTLMDLTDKAVQPVVAELASRYPDPECDLAESKALLLEDSE